MTMITQSLMSSESESGGRFLLQTTGALRAWAFPAK
jgi:hypothetical protein